MQDEAHPRPTESSPATGLAIGGALLAVAFLAIIVLIGSAPYGTWAAAVLAVGIVAISIPVLARQANREGDPRLLRLLIAGLIVKLGGTLIRFSVAFSLYGGRADASDYQHWGAHIAQLLRAGNFHTGLHGLTDTNFIRLLSGVVFTVIGPTNLGAWLIFSWLGFWGLFLFYRAFVLAVPDGRRRGYARLIFFLPSLVFWPSSLGKEAWMVFVLGLASYGAAHLYAGSVRRGFAYAALGLWGAAMVRPHIAGFMALGIVGGYLFRPGRRELAQLAPVAKILGLVALGFGAFFLVSHATQFLQNQGINTQSGLSSALAGITQRTQEGGSQFAPSILKSPARAPVAIVTVLFRPLVTDGGSMQAQLAGLEGTFLLLFSLARFPSILRGIRSARSRPYVAFVLIYAATFVLAFSSIANYGILARERVQLLPLFLALLCISPRRKKEPDRELVGAAIEPDAFLHGRYN